MSDATFDVSAACKQKVEDLLQTYTGFKDESFDSAQTRGNKKRSRDGFIDLVFDKLTLFNNKGNDPSNTFDLNITLSDVKSTHAFFTCIANEICRGGATQLKSVDYGKKNAGRHTRYAFSCRFAHYIIKVHSTQPPGFSYVNLWMTITDTDRAPQSNDSGLNYNDDTDSDNETDNDEGTMHAQGWTAASKQSILESMHKRLIKLEAQTFKHR